MLLLLIGRAVSGAGAHRQRVVDELAQQLHHLKQPSHPSVRHARSTVNACVTLVAQSTRASRSAITRTLKSFMKLLALEGLQKQCRASELPGKGYLLLDGRPDAH